MTAINEILLGRGTLRAAEFSAYIDDTAFVLPETTEVGSLEKCLIGTSLVYKKNINNQPILFNNELSLDATIMDASKSNLIIFFGGDGYENGVTMDVSSFSTYFRLEAFFTYPDGITKLGILIPKAYIASTKGINLVSLTEPSKPEIIFKSIPVFNDTWGTKTGEIFFL